MSAEARRLRPPSGPTTGRSARRQPLRIGRCVKWARASKCLTSGGEDLTMRDVRRGQGIGIVAAIVATTGLLALTSAPAGAGEPAQSGTVVTQPFEPPSAFPRFNTFPWYWP